MQNKYLEDSEINSIADRISDKLIAIVKKQLGPSEPPAEKGARWVRASERLPGAHAAVFVKIDSKTKSIASHSPFHEDFFVDDAGDFHPVDQIEWLDEAADVSNDSIAFAEWAAGLAYFDEEHCLWNLFAEVKMINGQFRFTTKEFYELFKKDGKP